MSSQFDHIIDRRASDSAKWSTYDPDVLPLWVADMDFAASRPIIQALETRIAHGVFGYAWPPKELRTVIQHRLSKRYSWEIEPDDILFIPGVVSGFNLVAQAVGSSGDEVLVQPPIYPPMLTAPGNAGRICTSVPLVEGRDRYEIDFDVFRDAIKPCTSLFLLCNPHNPSGRVFTKEELEHLAESCLANDIVICSDEIHCDIIFQGYEHFPIASLGPEVAANTVTLFAPSKTFNIPGLKCSIGVVQNPKLRAQIEKTAAGLVPHVNLLGYAAALAAYRDSQSWLDELLVYLEANRDFVLDFLATYLPAIKCKLPESTFLAWLDCRQAGIPGNPYEFFLENARVALNDGVRFGQGGEGFVRLNFGCPRVTLSEALERMRTAVLTGNNGR